MRVADYIAQTVENTGSEAFFMVSGGMMMHLMDAFGRLQKMQYYCNHHEQASAMAADAYSRESGKLGVCLATSGPGATNLLTGLVGAYQDSVPILFLTGQSKRAETIRASGIPGLRQLGFLEVDIVPIVQSVTKYAAFIESPERARYHLEKALYLAQNGRPGPVLLDVPLDVQGAPMPDNSEGFEPARDLPLPEQGDAMDSLLSRIANAKRPLILAGHGFRAAGLVQEFRELVEQLGVPVATTVMAKDLLPFDHPLFVGHPGVKADRGANFALQAADLLLIVGCSLHVMTTGYEGDSFAPNAHKIQIDVDPACLQREKVGVHEKHQWDIRQYVPAFLERAGKVKIRVPEKWKTICCRWKNSYCSANEPHVFGEPSSPVNAYEFVQLLDQCLDGTETLLTDAGQPFFFLPQALRLKPGQRYLIPGSLAEMGYGLGASLGAAVASPHKRIVAVLGDGSLQTNLQELQTLAHHKVDVKIFVINNDGYASIRTTQKTFFNEHYVGATPQSGVTLPSTEKIAAAYGIPYLRSENRSDAAECIQKTLSQPGLVLCEVMSLIDQRILPAVPSYLLPDGRMRSRALHEMAPDIGVKFEQLLADLI
jgi:acetolactate synthase-1/2/3 large subunit